MRTKLMCLWIIGMMNIGNGNAQSQTNQLLAVGFISPGQLEYGIGYVNTNPDCVMSSIEAHRKELLTDWEEAVQMWAGITDKDDMKSFLPELIQKKGVISFKELNNACIYANTHDTLPPDFSYDMPIFPQYEEEKTVYDICNYVAGITLFIPANKGQFKNWYDKTWFLYKNVLQISRSQVRRPINWNDELDIVQENFFNEVIEGIGKSPEYQTYMGKFDFKGKDAEAKKIGVTMMYLQSDLKLINFDCEDLEDFAQALW